MSHHSLPKRAALVDSARGVLPSGDFAGLSATVRHYRIPLGYADTGVEFVSINVSDGFRKMFRYSGRNLADAARQIAEFRAAISQ